MHVDWWDCWRVFDISKACPFPWKHRVILAFTLLPSSFYCSISPYWTRQRSSQLNINSFRVERPVEPSIMAIPCILGWFSSAWRSDVDVVRGRVDALLVDVVPFLLTKGHIHLCLGGFGTVSVAQRTVSIACEWAQFPALMGCAPSIHVSQSGIVIREEIRESSSPRPIVSSPSEIVGHIRSSSDSGSHISTSSSSRYRGSYKRSYYSTRGSSIEAETQTQDLSMTENIKVQKKIATVLLWLIRQQDNVQ